MTTHVLARLGTKSHPRWRWIPTKDIKPGMKLHSHKHFIIWDTEKGQAYEAHMTAVRFQ